MSLPLYMVKWRFSCDRPRCRAHGYRYTRLPTTQGETALSDHRRYWKSRDIDDFSAFTSLNSVDGIVLLTALILCGWRCAVCWLAEWKTSWHDERLTCVQPLTGSQAVRCPACPEYLAVKIMLLCSKSVHLQSVFKVWNLRWWNRKIWRFSARYVVLQLISIAGHCVIDVASKPGPSEPEDLQNLKIR